MTYGEGSSILYLALVEKDDTGTIPGSVIFIIKPLLISTFLINKLLIKTVVIKVHLS